MQQKVVFTGPTGVEKKAALKAVALEYLREKIDIDQLPTDKDDFFNDDTVQRYIQYFSLEKEVIEKAKERNKRLKHIVPLLADDDTNNLRDFWREGWTSLLKKQARVHHNVSIFIDLHLSYFRRQKRFILHDPNDILNLKPNCFITLLDDVYSIYHRINKRELTHAVTGSYLRLSDILEWRDLEMNLSDFFAASLNKRKGRGEKERKKIENFIFPVKHPACMLKRLIFDRDNLTLIYASYPITETRTRQKNEKISTGGDYRTDGQKEIDDNRHKFYQTPNIIFDPITIDERALQFAFQSVYGDDSIYSVPGGCLFSIEGDEKLKENLDKGDIPGIIRNTFETKGILLSEKITISPYPVGWKLIDEGKNNIYFIAEEGNKLNIYPENLSKKGIKLEEHHRWPLVLEGFPPTVPDPPDLFPLEMPAEEIHHIIYRPKVKGIKWKSYIDTQILVRDYYYIDKSEYMCAYRPQWHGKKSEGMEKEALYAQGQTTTRIAYFPKEDEAGGVGSPFEGLLDEVHQDKTSFYKRISNF